MSVFLEKTSQTNQKVEQLLEHHKKLMDEFDRLSEEQTKLLEDLKPGCMIADSCRWSRVLQIRKRLDQILIELSSAI